MLPERQQRPGSLRGAAADGSDSSTTWFLILHPPRRLWVTCSACGFSAINETNLLRRNGWQETATTPRRYRCGECAEAAS